MLGHDIEEGCAILIPIEDRVTDNPPDGVILCNCDIISYPIGDNLGRKLLFCNKFYSLFPSEKVGRLYICCKAKNIV